MDMTVSGALSRAFDQQTFGNMVVAKTTEYMSGSTSSASRAYDKETFDAALVTSTIDTMNSNQFRHQDRSTYTFQKDVLMPAYTGQGTILDSLV